MKERDTREGFRRVSIRKMELELSGRQVEVWTSGTGIGNNGRCKGRSGYHGMGMENIRIDKGRMDIREWEQEISEEIKEGVDIRE